MFTKTAIRNAMKRYGMTRGELERAMKIEGAMKMEDDSLVLVERWLAEQPPLEDLG
jgi:hypothetical protein